MNETTRPVFVLCPGSQKSGTTWLRTYLDSFDFSDFGPFGEGHIWEVRSGAETKRRVGPRKLLSLRRDVWLRFAMQNFDGFYERYFAGRIRGNVRMTGDVTPAYATLDAATFAEIRKRLEGKGFAVKVVFLMRDPVSRCVSAAEMQRRKAGDGSMFAHDQLRKRYASNFFQARTRYDLIIERLETVFGSGNVHYGFFENMFTAEALTELSGFLQIPAKTDFLDRKINAARGAQTQIDPALLAEIRSFYQPVYEYCFDRFPHTRELWAKR
ncbi:MAG: sulfotransferase domain-containing protein [Nitratireductor sp.]|nr:sulfotransferase domain-containing protein [Nitratireductor sp.]